MMEKKHVTAAAILLALLAGIGWAMFSGDDAELVQAEKMRDELLLNAEQLSPEERQAQFQSLRERTRDFTEEQKQAFGNGMRQFMLQRVDRLLAMPPEEQRQELDKWIDRMEERRQNNSERGAEGRGRGQRGGDMSQAERDQRSKQRLDRSTPKDRAMRDAMSLMPISA